MFVEVWKNLVFVRSRMSCQHHRKKGACKAFQDVCGLATITISGVLSGFFLAALVAFSVTGKG
jgi:hypothetical protein